MKKKAGRCALKIPTVLNAKEQAALMAELRYNGPIRNWLLARMMCIYGLRVSEARNLQVGHIDWEDGQTVIHGKGNKDRIMWIAKKDLLLLQEFKPDYQIQGHLFLSQNKKPLSIRYIRQMLKVAGEKAGLIKRVHPHLLRHTFATNLLRQTGDLLKVSEALGHADISTTTIYTHLVNDELKEALQAPREGDDYAPDPN